MFSAGQYKSTEKGYEFFLLISENTIFSNLNLTEIFY